MSRLTAELRGRCKVFASQVIRLYLALPKQREEVRVLGKQLLRSGTSVAAHAREASRARSDASFVPNWTAFCRRQTDRSCGWSCSVKITASQIQRSQLYIKKATS